MAQKRWEVPNFELSGFYYAEIIDDLLRFNREESGEITDEDPREPFVQIMRSFALAMHFSNVRLDIAANEAIFGSAVLRESIRGHLKLIGKRLKQLSPATAELVARVTNRFGTVPINLIPAGSIFSTSAGEVVDDYIEYECVDGLSIAQRNDKIGHVFSFESDTFTDRTTAAQAASNFTPWSSVVAGVMLYFIHQSIMWDRTDFIVNSALSRVIHAVWEFYQDDLSQGSPNEVENAGDSLIFTIDGMLGTTANRAGTTVRVMSKKGAYQDVVSTYRSGAPTTAANTGVRLKFNINSLWPEDGGTPEDHSDTVVVVRSVVTGNYQTATSTWDSLNSRNEVQTSLTDDPYLGQGSPSTTAADYWIDVGPNVIETTGDGAFLGQTSPSLVPGQYVVGTHWRELQVTEDETENFSALTETKSVRFVLPQNGDSNWGKSTVNGVEGFVKRYRVIASQAAVAPEIKGVRIDLSDQYVIFDVLQGRTVEDSPFTDTPGLPDFEDVLEQSPVLDNTVKLFVDEGSQEYRYTEVQNFLNSTASDRHFMIEVDDLGQGVVRFGGTIGGRIPPPGVDNVRATYRVAADIDGNVGAGAVSVNTDGVSFIDRISNPRAASGYKSREGATADDIARVKETYPAELQYGRVAANAAGVEHHVVNTFVPSDGGTSPVVRAKAIELGGASKTILLYVLGAGGGPLSSDMLTEIDEFFNGTDDGKVQGILVANQKVRTENGIRIPVHMPIIHYGGEVPSLTAALKGLLNPVAQDEDELAFEWDFGGKVSFARIIDVLMDTDPKPDDLTLKGDGTGYITGTGGGYVVVGTGTAFTEELNPGDKLRIADIPNLSMEIASIETDTELTLKHIISASFGGLNPYSYEKGNLQLGDNELPTLGNYSFAEGE